MEPQLAALIASGDVSFTYKDFVLPSHRPYAQWAAEAAQCAADQDKFWVYHSYLFDHQKHHTPADLKNYAGLLKLNSEEFNECLDSGKYTEAVNQSTQTAMDLKLTGTPTIIVNGRLLSLKATNLNRLDLVVKQELQAK